MNWINTETYRVVIFAVILSLFTSLLAKSRYSRALKQLSGAAMLFFIVSALVPLVSSFSEIEFVPPAINEEETEDEWDAIMLKATASALCKELTIALSDHFSLDEDELCVTVSLNATVPDSVRLQTVNVSLTKPIDAILVDRITEYVTDLTRSDCSVTVK